MQSEVCKDHLGQQQVAILSTNTNLLLCMCYSPLGSLTRLCGLQPSMDSLQDEQEESRRVSIPELPIRTTSFRGRLHSG